jgi:lysophospholipase L1-like esterase
LLAASLVTLVLAEVALRLVLGNLSIMEMIVLDSPDGRCVALRPGAAVPYTGFIWKIPPVVHDVNELGYRGLARPPQKPAGVVRIAVLGDSFAYGQAVKADETIAAYLEPALRSEERRQVEVLNFGVPGLNAEEYTEQFERFARKWQPDLVLVYLFENDLEPPMCDLARADTFWWYLRNVYVFRLVAFSSRMYGDSRPVAEKPVERLRSALEMLAAAVRTSGAKPAVVVLGDPLRHELREDENAPVSPLLRELLADADMPWLDMTPDTWGPQIPGEGHFTPEGNRQAAERTADWLRTTPGLIPETR